MKKYYISIYSLLLMACLAACKKEEILTPAGFEKNYFELTDSPGDEVDHARFVFYQDFGLPVFYKDTIGIQSRGNDPFGLPIVHYEILKINYNADGTTAPTTTTTAYYKNLSDRRNTLAALAFLRTNIMNVLPNGIKPASVLLTDSLNSSISGIYAYKGFNTVALGSVPRLSKLTAAQTLAYRAAVIRSIISPYILDNKNLSYLNANFYGPSRAYVSTTDIYNNTIFNILSIAGGTANTYGSPATGTATSLFQFGFLAKNPLNNIRNSAQFIYSPYSWMDVNMYIEAIFTYNTAQFTALYGSYPTIMKKYVAMKTLVSGLGFTLN